MLITIWGKIFNIIENRFQLEFAYDGNDLEQIANCSHRRWDEYMLKLLEEGGWEIDRKGFSKQNILRKHFYLHKFSKNIKYKWNNNNKYPLYVSLLSKKIIWIFMNETFIHTWFMFKWMLTLTKVKLFAHLNINFRDFYLISSLSYIFLSTKVSLQMSIFPRFFLKAKLPRLNFVNFNLSRGMVLLRSILQSSSSFIN